MPYVQISQIKGMKRGPKGDAYPPDDGFIELSLEPHQRILKVEWSKEAFPKKARKTADWTYVVTLESSWPRPTDG